MVEIHNMTRLVLAAVLIIPLAFGFAPSRPHIAISNPAINSNRNINTSLTAVASNPFNSLPWNVEKEKSKKARMLKLERSKLHRELGIAEDASYEEVVEATDRLIARAGDDLKRKIKIEVAKDKILQIRLNERLAGLAAASTEARAQSTFEVDGYVCAAHVVLFQFRALFLPKAYFNDHSFPSLIL